MIAALYVDPKGCYSGLPGVQCWGEDWDARLYYGPGPVVAHPPCQRWGQYDHGGPAAPWTKTPGADGGCFERALDCLQVWGGVLEHPSGSKAWRAFKLARPEPRAGWLRIKPALWTCRVAQGRYGHPISQKWSWLLVASAKRPPDLEWGPAPHLVGPDPRAVARVGYEKARRQGRLAQVGGKTKTAIREATPLPFRDLLLTLAREARL